MQGMLTLCGHATADSGCRLVPNGRCDTPACAVCRDPIVSPCRLLWGIPGRSNALNIAERLGLDPAVVAAARDKLGSAVAEVGGSSVKCS